MAPRKTTFNNEWLKKYPWLNSVPRDHSSAFCKLCKKIFSVSGKGEGSVKEHADGDTHRRNERAASTSHNLQRFFPRMFLFVFSGLMNL